MSDFSPGMIKVGLLKSIFLWLYNFVKMPGRIAELSKVTQNKDNRIKSCPNCEIRMKVDQTWSQQWNYRCPTCNEVFVYSF